MVSSPVYVLLFHASCTLRRPWLYGKLPDSGTWIDSMIKFLVLISCCSIRYRQKIVSIISLQRKLLFALAHMALCYCCHRLVILLFVWSWKSSFSLSLASGTTPFAIKAASDLMVNIFNISASWSVSHKEHLQQRKTAPARGEIPCECTQCQLLPGIQYISTNEQ